MDGDSRQLEESLQFVRQQEMQMRKCLETKGKLLDAIRHASTFLAELRSSVLTPKQYYELYIAVFDALGYLATFLKEDHPNHHLADIYELVQYAGNIIPRLYLMITVGTVYMSVPDAPVKEIMKDMMEMCRGVQHPIRGLFLRYYLTQAARDYLPTRVPADENGSDEGDERGTIKDSVQFVLTNFIEMNKLWVRLQHQGHSRDRERRIKERQELQILVGSNLVRLSQLEGISKSYYKESILPAILEQVVQCRDVLAQEYLLDVICQVFPDEFHLATLDMLLQATTNLNPNVNINKALLPLVSRLADFASRERDNGLDLEEALRNARISEGSRAEAEKNIDNSEESTAKEEEEEEEVEEEEQNQFDDKDLFQRIWSHFQELIRLRPDISIQDRTALLQALVRLALSWYPDRMDYVDTVLEFAYKDAEKVASDENSKVYPREAAANVLYLLRFLITFFSRPLYVLNIPNYLPLLSSQPATTQRAIAADILSAVLGDGVRVSSAKDVDGLFGLIEIIISNKDNQSSVLASVAKVVHLLWNKNVDIHYKLLRTAKSRLSKGSNVSVIYPALLTNVWKLVKRVYKKSLKNETEDKEDLIKVLLKFSHGCIDEVLQSGEPELALRLFVDSAKIADQCCCEEAGYEFYVDAFTVYEESISDSRAQFQAICIITGALQSAQTFSLENYDTLISKCALYGSKLLKKADQCRAVYLSSHLWWSEGEADGEGEESSISRATSGTFKDDKRVLECLQRALRVADACMDLAASAELFVEILNRYLYFFDHGCPAVSVRYINGLIELTQTNLTNNADETTSDSPRKHFERTLDYITKQKEVDEKFRDIVW